MFQGDKKLEDAPHMEGKHEDSKDTRPRTIVSEPPVAPHKQPETTEPQQPTSPKERSKEAETQEKVQKEPKEPPVEPEKKLEVTPEPTEKEVIRLTKKLPDPTAPAAASPPAMTPRVISAASSRNTGADAQITGELSFGATRHFFGEYLLKMKHAVERQWISQLVSRYTGIVSSSAVIEFKIQPDGTVTNVVVSENKGDPYFPLVCVSSINDAQPFDRIPYDEISGLPDHFMNKPLSIRFTFNYN